MNAKIHTQIIERKGKPEYAVVPYDEYCRMLSTLEDVEDSHAVREFRVALAKGEEELVPADVVRRLVAGESPIRVWRVHRELTIAQLAGRLGVSPATVSRLESGNREPSARLLRKLADVLGTDADGLLGRRD